MERKEFLRLCQIYASGVNAVVTYNGISYHPISYTISFDANKNAKHTVRLRDTKVKNSYVEARLDLIEQQ